MSVRDSVCECVSLCVNVCVCVCLAKNLTFLIQNLAAPPATLHCCVYACCPVQNGFLSVNHHVPFFQRVFCRISFAEHRGQYLG